MSVHMVAVPPVCHVVMALVHHSVSSVDHICTRIRGRRTHLPVVLLRIRYSAKKKEGGQATVTVRDKMARAS